MKMHCHAHTPDPEKIRKMFKLENPNERVRLYIEEGTHTNPYTGEQMSRITLANILYYGAKNIPARPFWKDFMREEKEQIDQIMMDACIAKRSSILQFFRLKKKTVYIDYEHAGPELLQSFRDFLFGPYYQGAVPNAQFTIDRKGGDLPLVDTHDLVDNVKWKVVDIGGVV